MIYNNADEMICVIKRLSSKGLYIVGGGRYGQVFGEYFCKYQIPWLGYIDRNAKLKEINGKKVYSYQEAVQNKAYYFISSYIHRDELITTLCFCGVDRNQIITYEDQNIFYEIYEDIIHWSKQTERLRKLKDIYEGKRCFIIGNGPSLKIEDLEKIDTDYSFACNSIYALYSQTKWRPSFYCASDSIFCKTMMSDKSNMKKVTDGCQMAFTSIVGAGIQYRNDPNFADVYYMKTLFESPVKFSADCSEQIYSGGTIAYEMLQLAVYMGFKKIYLLGIDCNYAVERHEDGCVTRNNVMDHMRELEEEEKEFWQAIEDRYGEKYFVETYVQLAAYQKAKTYADTHDIKIYNATRGGKLEVFPRVDFNSLFG